MTLLHCRWSAHVRNARHSRRCEFAVFVRAGWTSNGAESSFAGDGWLWWLPVLGLLAWGGLGSDPGTEGRVSTLRWLERYDLCPRTLASLSINATAVGFSLTHSLTFTYTCILLLFIFVRMRLPSNVGLIVFVVACYSGGHLNDAKNGKFHVLENNNSGVTAG